MKIIPKHLIPEGWYQLESGVTLESGDCAFFSNTSTFRPTVYVGFKVGVGGCPQCAYIRKITLKFVPGFVGQFEFQLPMPSLNKLKAIVAYYGSLGYSFGTGTEKLASYQFLFINITTKYISANEVLIEYRNTITFDEVFDLVETYKPVDVKLNGSYTATVLKNGKVKVGCQEFDGEVVLELAKKVQESIDFNK